MADRFSSSCKDGGSLNEDQVEGRLGVAPTGRDPCMHRAGMRSVHPYVDPEGVSRHEVEGIFRTLGGEASRAEGREKAGEHSRSFWSRRAFHSRSP
jgi:hypothetical protein